MFLPRVEHHQVIPVGRDLLKAVVAAELHQIEDVFLETTAANAQASLQKFAANSVVSPDRLSHLPHIGAGGLAEGSHVIDRADPLGHKRIGRELGGLTTPQVNEQDLPGRYPVSVDPGEGFYRLRNLTTD